MVAFSADLTFPDAGLHLGPIHVYIFDPAKIERSTKAI
jgi:hypothetical protein